MIKITLIAVLIASCLSFSLSIIQGPQVGNNKQTSFIVGWQTDTPSDSKLEWGLSPNALTGSAQDSDSRQWHVLKADNLQAETVYYYRVTSGSVQSPIYHTKTAVKRDSPFRFSLFTDTHGGSVFNVNSQTNRFHCLIVLEDSADLWFNTGDVVGTNSDPDEDACFQMILKYKQYTDSIEHYVPINEVYGNHDGGTDNIWANSDSTDYAFILPEDNIYTGRTKGHFYSFDYGVVHYTVLDYGQNSLDTGAMDWLVADLQAARDRGQIHNIILNHYGIIMLESGQDWNLNLWEEGWYRAKRSQFYHILDTLNVEVLFHGHWHNYCRARISPAINAGFASIWNERGFNNQVYDISLGAFGGSRYSCDTSTWKVDVYTKDIPNSYGQCNVDFRQILYRHVTVHTSYSSDVWSTTVIDSFKTRPDAPLNLFAETTGAAVELSWDNVEDNISLHGVGGYYIYRSEVSYDSIRNTTQSKYVRIGSVDSPDVTFFVDSSPNLAASDKYYVVSAYDTNYAHREGNYSNEARAGLGTGAIELGLIRNPVHFKMSPNPASTHLRISVMARVNVEDVRLEILNLNGKVIKRLRHHQNTVSKVFEWNGKTDTRKKASPGIYLVRLTFNKKNYYKKLLWIR